jgi:ribonuclease BN (tRNA processing enzyme)
VTLTLLGSGGWIPSARRETCSALLRDGEDAVLIDAGTGVSRLLEQPALLDGVGTLEVVLTHFHLDHVVGLAYLPALTCDARVWGPGEWLYERRTEDILRRLLDPPLFAADVGDFVSQIGEIGADGIALGGVRLDVRVQELHPQPTLALRRGDEFAYCTDTAVDSGNIEFAAGVRTLYHEAWHAQAETDDRTHTASGEAGRVAREAGAGELVLIHVSPLLTDDEALLAPARAEFGATAVGVDLQER